MRFLFILFFILSCAAAQAQEETITNFSADVYINPDASIDVIENISVYANQKKILHGIVRWLPTSYSDSYGVLHKTNYDIQKIQFNNMNAPYHIRSAEDKIAIYIGDKKTNLPAGNYLYTLHYHVDAAINFLQDADELYWNVTGNNWDFAIEEARVTIHLPQNAPVMNYYGYMGKTGDTEQSYSVEKPAENQIAFYTTQPLSPNEGMTIAVSWPKGYVHSPTVTSQIIKVLKNKNMLLAVESIFLLLIYYLIAWYLVGRDLHSTIFPLFEPPENLSPAATRYIFSMGYNIKAFTAAIISMATKGCVTLENKDNKFTVIKNSTDISSLSSDEKILYENLFKNAESILLTKVNNDLLRQVQSQFKNNLKLTCKDKYFLANSVYTLPGILLSCLALVAIVMSSYDVVFALNALIVVVTVNFLLFTLFSAFISAAREIISDFSFSATFKLLRILFFLVIILGAEIGIIFSLGNVFIATSTILTLIVVVLNLLFYQLLKAPTEEGRKVMAQIAGFKLFLSVTEKYRFEQLHPPEKTLKLFEKYLPYAIALDVENKWSEQFNDVILAANQLTRTPYHPMWYVGTGWSLMNVTSISNNLTSSISTSVSMIESSSSASGGSGFSGGGRGGGGGGGW